ERPRRGGLVGRTDRGAARLGAVAARRSGVRLRAAAGHGAGHRPGRAQVVGLAGSAGVLPRAVGHRDLAGASQLLPSLLRADSVLLRPPQRLPGPGGREQRPAGVERDRGAIPQPAQAGGRLRIRAGDGERMIEPTVPDVLAAVAATIERDIAPNVVADDDGYTASLCRTVVQMLRMARSRIEHEESALAEDNAELRELLATWASALPAEPRRTVEAALREKFAAPTTV